MVVKPGLAPIFSMPLLVSVPVPMLREPPLNIVPVLFSDTLLRRKTAPCVMLMVPTLMAKPVPDVKVPAVADKVPLLTNELVAMVVVWPATFCRMVPLLTRPPVLLWLKLVWPEMVIPAPMVRVLATP